MNTEERTRRHVQELEALGIALNSDDEHINRLVQELAAEKEAQLERAKAVPKPLTFGAAILVFASCFRR